jgi:hypothetical protein
VAGLAAVARPGCEENEIGNEIEKVIQSRNNKTKTKKNK